MPGGPRLHTVVDETQLAAALGPRPDGGRAVALIGGADRLPEAAVHLIGPFVETVAVTLDRLRTALVDGGTDSGVMRLIGAARTQVHGTFRLVGVVPAGTLDRPSRDGRTISLARDHPEIILVPGDQFGDETIWLYRTADYLGSGTAPTIVVNGGELSLKEAQRRLAAGHVVIAVAGSGRAADILAGNEDAQRSLRVVSLDVDSPTLAAVLESSGGGGGSG
jgi:hypothetical protein